MLLLTDFVPDLLAPFIEARLTKPLLQKYPRLGGFDDIEQVLQAHPVHEVIIAAPGLPRDRLVQIFYRVQPYVRKTSLIPDLFGIPIANVRTERSLDDHLLVLKTTNSLQRRTNRWLKRAFDLAAGSVPEAARLRPARDAGRALYPEIQHRRAAADFQRAARGDEPRGAASVSAA